MSTYDPRTPLENGTVLRTMDGKTFHILRFTAASGNALLYAARLDGSALDVTLKEIFPAGCTRVDGLAADPALGAPDAPEAMRKSFYDRLARQAQKELEMSQRMRTGSLHALPHLEQLAVRALLRADGSPLCAAQDDAAPLPCSFLYLPTLNASQGFFLREMLDECAAYPHSAEHPFGAPEPEGPGVTAVPHVLTTLRLIRLTLEALQTLHKTAIHGDISLGNLFVDGDLHRTDGDPYSGVLRGVVFLDFGSARLLDVSGKKTAPILPTEDLYTTQAFCAPELQQGADSGEPFCLTPAADVYSVGVLLRFLLKKEAAAAWREWPARLAEELAPGKLYKTDVGHTAWPVLPELNALLRCAEEPDPAVRCTAQEMLEGINAILAKLNAPRFLLEENLSSPEDFVPHSRDEQLRQLEQKLQALVRPIFVSGWGGLGKTETVRAFLRQCKQKGRKVAFFSYEHSVRRTILDLQFSGYQYTPSRTSLTQEQQEEELYRQKLALLAGMGPDSVIVMDNFDSSSQTLFQMQREPAYRDLIELAGPHLIITTRFEPGGDPVKIGPLPEEMLLQLMRQYDTASPEDTLREIIRDVKGHTLTCYLIVRCVGDAWGTLTAQKVLDALRKADLHTLPQEVPSDKDRRYTEATIYGHLKVLFDLTGMIGAYRAALCHTLLLPQGGLDATLFLRGEAPAEQAALRDLAAHGWVQRDAAANLLTIHPLIRELIWNELKPTAAEYDGFLQMIRQEDYLSTQEENSRAMRKLDLAQCVLSLPILPPSAGVAQACCITGFHDFKRGRRLESIRLYDRGLSIYRLLSAENPQCLYRYAAESGTIGFLMSATNEYQPRSAELLRQAVAIWKRLEQEQPGKYRVEYATACDNLGYQLSLSHDVATHREAEAVLREALAIRQQLYQQDPGRFRRDYAWTADNLGKVLTRDSGSFAEAEELLRTALQLREEMNRESGGKNISEVAWTCHNLGQLLAKKPEYAAEAEQCYRTSIRLRQKLEQLSPGTHAADTSWVMFWLAELLSHDPARHAETGELYCAALEIQQKVEQEHPGMFVLNIDRIRERYESFRNGIQ